MIRNARFRSAGHIGLIVLLASIAVLVPRTGFAILCSYSAIVALNSAPYRPPLKALAATGAGALTGWLSVLFLPFVETRWSIDGSDLYCVWFLGYGATIGAATGLIVMVWRRWSRASTPERFSTLRFSTRGLLALMTVVCIVAAAASARFHQRSRAVELANRWAESGVQFTFDYRYRPISAWTNNFTLACVSPLDDQMLEELTQLTSLRSLSLVTSNVTDDGIVHLSRLRSLRQLMVGGLPITDAGAAMIEIPSLREVDLFNTHVTATAAASLSRLPNLRYVRIHPQLVQPMKAQLVRTTQTLGVGETIIEFDY